MARLSNLAAAAAGASQRHIALEFASRAVKANPAAQYYKRRAAILQRLERFDAQADLARAQQLEKESAMRCAFLRGTLWALGFRGSSGREILRPPVQSTGDLEAEQHPFNGESSTNGLSR